MSRKKLRIILDPGHGGRDPGTVWDDYREKDAVLLFVEDLKPRLDDHASVCFTRAEDKYVTLKNRCIAANGYHSDVFLSVHLNAIPKVQRDAGVEAVGMEIWTFEGSFESRRIGEEILYTVGGGFKGYKIRGIRETNKLHVLKGTSMPACLIELGFIDSLHDRTLLQNRASRDRLVQLVAEGVLRATEHLGT